ncbi:SDR family oxidoreductase [Leptotrichia sp. oral taxon 223]|uniref:SDR family NAD(P)-dependent oxidoreductase n=1 Tax=Leptotrichia sp. oral taxon 223 TaxID=712363 RepID=UPI0015BA6033|nr:SDR family oxidoreductase [Leptotrichia sp. oral taxon 223]NWO18365.1 SDR family oxidoreductase [Leptotrichia sp. oral taxon 223]
MKTVLITGASSGIGYELAKIYAENGYNLVVVARNGDKLEILKKEIFEEISKNIEVIVIENDLSQENAAERLYNQIKSSNLKINTLVNNAGVGIYGKFSEFDEETMKRNDAMINLNIKAVVELTRLFLADMIKNENGEILNVSSVAAFMPGPLMSTYYASKAFVQSFTEAVREEMRNDIHAKNIKISVLCPGPTATGFEKSSNLEESSLFERMKVMTAKKVAEIGYKEFQKGKATIIPGIFNRIAVFGTRFFSRKLIVRTAGKIQEKKKGS